MRANGINAGLCLVFGSVLLLGAALVSMWAMYRGTCDKCGGIVVCAEATEMFSDTWSGQCLRCGRITAQAVPVKPAVPVKK